MFGKGVSMDGRKVVLVFEPQAKEDVSRDRGIILVDTCGKRSEFSLETADRRERARRKRPRVVRGWASRFCREARGRVTAHTYRQENGTTTIFPASEELRQILLGESH